MHVNPHLTTARMSILFSIILLLIFLSVQSPNLRPVKYQILNCQGQDILVSLYSSFISTRILQISGWETEDSYQHGMPRPIHAYGQIVSHF